MNSSPLYCTEYVIHTGCGRGAVRVATVPGGMYQVPGTVHPVPYSMYRGTGSVQFQTHTEKKLGARRSAEV